ncbi:uncharacterized protein AMSG_03660 [Thecamonas trahens ATCC 50062]|uniref:Uncharacterized protein n=1 Tax=Thecamonas trahens ATCC 50062 TaxID=461836 RepID=A0A0L0D4D9_THETB|nr:hypothetical protein AMSG_03660 [Thecamonas trahens ATCC 50062]KNC47232.1 hypothetical protein AMSG_03660 [Thecamonas trahens ATCC 50062]|eukprot:XP_013759575.1 hypothetical protein AMSG_03660 [Thecamonas trahens ATCC 50062]
MSWIMDKLWAVWDEEFGFREKNVKRRLNIKLMRNTLLFGLSIYAMREKPEIFLGDQPLPPGPSGQSPQMM